MAVTRVLGAVLLLLAGGAAAGPSGGVYAVRALGVKVGDLALTGSQSAERYTLSSQFATSGLVGALAHVRFQLRASGRRDGDRLLPQRYAEEMDTGRRQSQARLVYADGIARSAGAQDGAAAPFPVAAAQQQGAVDPLTAMFLLLRDQPRDGLCRIRQKVFDGTRLTQIELTERRAEGEAVICAGQYRRLAGYPPRELGPGGRFDLTVTYAPAGGLMRAMRVRVDTIYGPATLHRR